MSYNTCYNITTSHLQYYTDKMYSFGNYWIKDETLWGCSGPNGSYRQYARKQLAPIAPGGGHRHLTKFISEAGTPIPPDGTRRMLQKRSVTAEFEGRSSEDHLACLKMAHEFKCAEGWLFTSVSNDKLYLRGTFQLAIDILTKDVLTFGYGRSQEHVIGPERVEIASALASTFPHLNGDIEGQIKLLRSLQKLRDEENFDDEEAWKAVHMILAKLAIPDKEMIDPRDSSW